MAHEARESASLREKGAELSAESDLENEHATGIVADRPSATPPRTSTLKVATTSASSPLRPRTSAALNEILGLAEASHDPGGDETRLRTPAELSNHMKLLERQNQEMTALLAEVESEIEWWRPIHPQVTTRLSSASAEAK
eukprot:m.10927 g.10927  ORF g.10927 m.10927 type:complete len:140 (+) comp14484_c0_seq1:120-539(+)